MNSESHESQTSERRILANRANALKSTGPVTEEGKQRSSQNSLRHGLLAQTVVLEGESFDRFSALLASLQADFLPEAGVESSLVETMAVARWRLLRLWSMEKSGIEYEIEKQENEPDNEETLNRDAPTRAAIAFRTLSDNSRSLDLFNRYEARYSREYHRALRTLIDLRQKPLIPERSQRGCVE